MERATGVVFSGMIQDSESHEVEGGVGQNGDRPGPLSHQGLRGGAPNRPGC